MVAAILITCAQSFSKKHEVNCGRAMRAHAASRCTCETKRSRHSFQKLSGSVSLEVFPKASYGEIAWVGFALGFDHFDICGHIPINYRRGRKNLNPGFEGNIVVNIEG